MKLSLLLAIPAFSFEIPLCIHCKHYRNAFFTDSKFGKCALFPIVVKDYYYLVNGVKPREAPDYYCSTARSCDRMCGEEGKHFEQK
jgi:hypothetical protein